MENGRTAMTHDGSTEQHDDDRQDSCADTQADEERKDGRPDTRLYKKVCAFNEFIDETAKGLSPAESLVWLVLVRFARDGIAMASKATVAERAGVSEKTVARSITKLEKLGLLKVEYHGGYGRGSNRYRLGIRPLEPKRGRAARKQGPQKDPADLNIKTATESSANDQPAGKSRPKPR